MGNWSGAFQAKIALQHLHDFGRQRHSALFSAFAQDALQGIGQFQILELERQDFARTQAVEQHEAHHGEIAEGAKTCPKPGDLLGRQRLDHAPRLLEAETEGDIAVGTTIADRTASRIGALEMGMAAGDLLSEVESIQATNHRQAMIYGLRSRAGVVGSVDGGHSPAVWTP